MKKRWLVVTPEYDVKIPITDEGEGPTESEADTFEIEAETRRDAISLGVKFMLKDANYRWCKEQRRDNRSPYTGVQAWEFDSRDDK